MLPARWIKRDRFPITFQYTRRLQAQACACGAELIHDHGLWLQSNWSASRAAEKLGVPFFSSPRGTLSPWALRHNPIRKRVAWGAYQGRALRNARVLFASSETEADGFRALGLMQPIAILPNGVELAPERSRPGEGPRTLLYLGRLHASKGLLELLDAWSRALPVHWRLIIAGPDEGGFRGAVERRIEELGLGRSVTLLGEVGDRAKSELYQSAELFVLPTHSENFGMVVAEAMAHGLPVITTRAAPWAVLQKEAAGWWVEPTPAALEAAIVEAASLPEQVLRSMGSRARAIAAERLSWESVATRMTAVYRWAVMGGERPAWVRME